MEDGLYLYDTSCPLCGKKTEKKQLGLATFIICQDFFNCDYFEIESIESIVENPSELRQNWEKEWYKERFRLFLKREKERIKREFIAKEMERLRKEKR